MRGSSFRFLAILQLRPVIHLLLSWLHYEVVADNTNGVDIGDIRMTDVIRMILDYCN